MTPSDSVRDRVRAFITTNFYLAAKSELHDQTSLLEQGIVDSTGMLEVIAFLEKTFEIAVDDSEVTPENLDSLGRITAFVARKKTRLATAS
jgi:acyl carrier protein